MATDTQPDLRHEIKLVSQAHSAAAVRARLTLMPHAISTLHPSRTVQTIYLDTLMGQALQDNLAGISHRRKFRFRWYGERVDQSPGRLEIKVRHADMGWKHIHLINEPIALEGVHGRDFMAELRRQSPPAWQSELDHGLQPVQWLRYRRDYLATADERVRITLDHDLKAHDLRLGSLLQCHRPTPLQRFLVVECKCAPEHWRVAQEIINSLGLPQSRCSKFMTATSPGDGPPISLTGLRGRG